jgi:hypothetical protein
MLTPKGPLKDHMFPDSSARASKGGASDELPEDHAIQAKPFSGGKDGISLTSMLENNVTVDFQDPGNTDTPFVSGV